MRSKAELAFSHLITGIDYQYEPGTVPYMALYRPDFRLLGADIEVKCKLTPAERKIVAEVAAQYKADNKAYIVAVQYNTHTIRPYVSDVYSNLPVVRGKSLCSWLSKKNIHWFCYNKYVLQESVVEYIKDVVKQYV